MICKFVVALVSLSFAGVFDEAAAQTPTRKQLLDFLPQIPLISNDCTSMGNAGAYTQIFGLAYLIKFTLPARCFISKIENFDALGLPLPLSIVLQSSYSNLDENNVRKTPPPATVIVRLDKAGEGIVVADSDNDGQLELFRTTEVVAFLPGKGYALASCVSKGLTLYHLRGTNVP